MGEMKNKLRNKAEELEGEAKQTYGKAIGDEHMEAEGQLDQAKGNVKQAAEKMKDVFR